MIYSRIFSAIIWLLIGFVSTGRAAAPKNACTDSQRVTFGHEDRRLADAIAQYARLLEQHNFFRELSAVHEHLEMYGDEQSLRTLYQWAIADGFHFCSFEDFITKNSMLRPFPERQGGLDYFLSEVIPLYAKVIGKSEIRIEQWSYLAVRAAAKQQITRLALRFSPGFLTSQSTLSWDQALHGVLRGLARALQDMERQGRTINLQLYQIATREMSGSDNALFKKNVEFFLINRRYFAAFDIAGSELLAPIANFRTALMPLIVEKAKDLDIHFTFHAGEEIANANRSMLDAMEAGASRLGHGINGYHDPEVNRLINEKHIAVEVCPTSNWIVGVVPSYSAHPLPILLNTGYQPSLSTDDPLVFSVLEKNAAGGEYGLHPLNLKHEYARTFMPVKSGGMGLSLHELLQLKANGKKQFEAFQPRKRSTLNTVLRDEFFQALAPFTQDLVR